MQAMPTPSWAMLALIVPRVYHGFTLTPSKHTSVFKRKHTHSQWLPAATTYLPASIHPRPSPPFTSPQWLTAHLQPCKPLSQTHMHIEGKGHPRFNLSSITMVHVHDQARGLTQIAQPQMEGEREDCVLKVAAMQFTRSLHSVHCS